MANPNDVKNALSTQDTTTGLKDLIERSVKEIGKVLPEHMRPERLTRIALTCIRTNPALAQCSPASFMGALFVAAQIGIEPVAGRAYILPFNNSRKKPDGTWHTVKEAQYILGYKGVAELFYRNERAVQLSWGVVKEGDEFEYQYGTKAFLNHRPSRTPGKTLGYYAIAKLQNGGEPFMYMTADECMEHGIKHSKTYDKKTGKFFDNSPWVSNTDAMCLKTVLVQLAKLLPLSVELQRAIAVDETSREFKAGIDDALDLPETTTWEEEPNQPANKKDSNGNA